jgi:hypothetical protein
MAQVTLLGRFVRIVWLTSDIATENRSVGGSIPPLGTISLNDFNMIVDASATGTFSCFGPGYHSG